MGAMDDVIHVAEADLVNRPARVEDSLVHVSTCLVLKSFSRGHEGAIPPSRYFRGEIHSLSSFGFARFCPHRLKAAKGMMSGSIQNSSLDSEISRVVASRWATRSISRIGFPDGGRRSSESDAAVFGPVLKRSLLEPE